MTAPTEAGTEAYQQGRAAMNTTEKLEYVIRFKDSSRPVYFTQSELTKMAELYGFEADEAEIGEVSLYDEDCGGEYGWVLHVD